MNKHSSGRLDCRSPQCFGGRALVRWLPGLTVALALSPVLLAPAAQAESPPTLTLNRPQDQSRFRVTTFASGLSFPTSMASLSDGSLLVATNNGLSIFGSPTGNLLRLVDSDDDGFADGAPTVLATGFPGAVTSVRRVDDLVLTLSSTQERISLWRTGATPSSPLIPAGSLNFSFPGGFSHSTYALAARVAPSNPSAVEVFFNLGGQGNNSSTTATVGLAGDGSGVVMAATQLAANSIHRLTLTATGLGSQLSGAVQQVAKGLRNAAGMVFAANGDLLLHDNGIDTPGNPDVSLSSDELNRIAAADLGVVIPDFGFPNTYVSAATGQTIANGVVVCDGICATPGVTPPRLAFRPIGTERSEGAVEIALAPPGFPADFAGGVFSAFFGKFAGGAANDENPVVFSDPATGTYFHFIPNQLLGHPNGLMARGNSLFLTDLDYGGNLGGTTKGTIYQITNLDSPPPPPPPPTEVPAPLPLLGAAAFLRIRRLRELAQGLESRRSSQT